MRRMNNLRTLRHVQTPHDNPSTDHTTTAAEESNNNNNTTEHHHEQPGRPGPQVSCGWWRPGHVTTCSPLIGPQGDEHGAAGAEGGHHGPDDDGDRWELNNQYWNLKNPKMLILLFIIKFQNNLYFWPQAPCSPCPEPTWPSLSRRLPRPTQPPSH